MMNVAETQLEEVTGAEAVRRSLVETVRRQVIASGTGSEEAFTQRVTVPAPGLDLFGWLRAQSSPRGYWRGRAEGAASAFAGVAERFENPARLCAHRLADAPADAPADAVGRRRYYGGLRFDPAQAPADGWERFGPGAFVLPRFELVQDDEGRSTLACHLAPSEDDPAAVTSDIKRMPLPAAAPSEELLDEPIPSPIRRRDLPERGAWDESVEAALAAIAEGTLQKVVLARRVTLAFRKKGAPVALLRRLVEAAPNAFHFLFQPTRAGAFLGATPERLFRQRGRRVWSEAVAGTRPRAEATEDDAALQESLLQSDKDRREHAFVQRHIRRMLERLGAAVREEDASAMTLRRGRHLRARLEGRFSEDVAPADVLRALHPTPAVGGMPTGRARRFIRAHEPFDRGWYAAPVGWIGVEDGQPAAELAVGLRCGLVQERRLDLFSGAGLVEGSVPEAEWDEVEQKLGNFAAVLGRASGAERPR